MESSSNGGPIQHAAVIGAGVGGLSAALGLARTGVRVTVIDRDPAPAAEDPEALFASWDRSGVTQFRQPHFFWARSRNLLRSYAPQVLDRLEAIGVRDWNVLDLAPAEMREPDDEQFASLLVRRLPFELTLRHVAGDEPLVEIRQESIVEGLEFATDEDTSSPRVTGVRLRDGTPLAADVVIDASGRRTRIPELLTERGAALPTQVQDTNMVYYGRLYRQHEHSQLNQDELILKPGGSLGYLHYGRFPGDNRTFGFFINPPPWDKGLRLLRHDRAWEAASHLIPGIAPWIDPDNSAPITSVQPMAGLRNVVRRLVVDGRPLVRGVLPVGDALCTTNPAFAWGGSLALTHGFAAAQAIEEHGPDLNEIAHAYDAAVGDEAEAYFHASAAQDRIRTYRWRGEEVPTEDRDEAERQALLEHGLRPAMLRDMHVLRAMMRRFALIDPPDAIWSDEQALSVAREVMAEHKANQNPSFHTPPREQMLEAMQAATTHP